MLSGLGTYTESHRKPDEKNTFSKSKHATYVYGFTDEVKIDYFKKESISLYCCCVTVLKTKVQYLYEKHVSLT